MQAVIGRIQLEKLNGWIRERQKNASILYRGLDKVKGIKISKPPENINHAYYRFYAFLDLKCISDGWDQIRVLEQINLQGVPCFVGSCGEIYKEDAFKLYPDIHQAELHNSRELFETSLAFLVHPGLSNEALEFTIKTVKNVMQSAKC